LFGVALPSPAVLAVPPLIAFVSVSTYAVGVFLGALVRWSEARNVVANAPTFS
jgi:ABC-type multidrug transport system permease subunit